MNQPVEPRKYFDLHLRGLGYLSRVRDVTANGSGRSKARPFLACAISAFHGDPNVENGVVYLPLDLIVSGDRAKEVVRTVMDDANDPDAKVLVSFRSGDHYIRTFERTGNRAGETGAVLKGRLLKVFWIKVDGEVVYRDEGDDADAGAGTSGETVNGHEPAPEPHDQPATPPVEEPANAGGTGESGDGTPAAARATPEANRYPPLRRRTAANVRRPSGNDR